MRINALYCLKQALYRLICLNIHSVCIYRNMVGNWPVLAWQTVAVSDRLVVTDAITTSGRCDFQAHKQTFASPLMRLLTAAPRTQTFSWGTISRYEHSYFIVTPWSHRFVIAFCREKIVKYRSPAWERGNKQAWRDRGLRSSLGLVSQLDITFLISLSSMAHLLSPSCDRRHKRLSGWRGWIMFLIYTSYHLDISVMPPPTVKQTKNKRSQKQKAVKHCQVISRIYSYSRCMLL